MEVSSLYTAKSHNKGAELQVRDADGKLTEIYLILAGVDSEAWRAGLKEAQRNALDEASHGKKIALNSAQLLVNVTLGWRGLQANGKEYKFTKKRALQLYTEAPYIRDQADAFFTNRANFTRG